MSDVAGVVKQIPGPWLTAKQARRRSLGLNYRHPNVMRHDDSRMMAHQRSFLHWNLSWMMGYTSE